jgi:hypothetical protein
LSAVESVLHAALALAVTVALLGTDLWIGYALVDRPSGRPTVRELLPILVVIATRFYVALLPWGYHDRVWWLWVALGGLIARKTTGLWSRPSAAGARCPPLAVAALLFGLLVLPSFLEPVARHWDVSGWMDSQSYDRFAHQIATGRAIAGSSEIMPLYQYGLAFIYFVFGHFSFVQQIVNVILGVAGVGFLMSAGWSLFPSRIGLVMVALWAGLNPAFTYPVYFTQIESWYVPSICFALFAWSRYWRVPGWRRLALMALAAAIVLNIRQQGFVFAIMLCLAPALVPGLDRPTRLRHGAGALAILALSLLPWTIRNAMVEGRISPFGLRSAAYLAILNDRRIPFYGVRYDQGFGLLLEEYNHRYPAAVERERAMMRDARARLLEDPVWLGKAVFWRAMGFYGLLPPGVYATPGPRPTRPDEWRPFLSRVMPCLLLIGISIAGFVAQPGRTTTLVAALIAGNLSVVLLSPTGGDPRISFPSYPLHILLSLAVFGRQRSSVPDVVRLSHWYRDRRVMCGLAATACLTAVLCREFVGRPNAFRRLREHSVVVEDKVMLDPGLPRLNDDMVGGERRSGVHRLGARVRASYIVTNEMYPPKFMGAVEGLPRFAGDPKRETYYVGSWPDGHAMGVAYAGATVEPGIREGDAVEAEGVVMAEGAGDAAPFWLKAERVRRLSRPGLE